MPSIRGLAKRFHGLWTKTTKSVSDIPTVSAGIIHHTQRPLL